MIRAGRALTHKMKEPDFKVSVSSLLSTDENKKLAQSIALRLSVCPVSIRQRMGLSPLWEMPPDILEVVSKMKTGGVNALAVWMSKHVFFRGSNSGPCSLPSWSYIRFAE